MTAEKRKPGRPPGSKNKANGTRFTTTLRGKRVVQIAVLLNPEDLEALTRLAAVEERTPSAHVRYLIRQYLNASKHTEKLK